MSNSETVIDQSRKLLATLSDYVAKMPRDRKFTIGDRVISLGLDLLENLVEAYYGARSIRVERLDRANVKLEILRQLLRHLHETGGHNLRKHEHLNREIDGVGSCIGGWRKSMQARQ